VGYPLQGVKVLDFTQMLPGAMCTLQLADMGAEVVKIEPPGRGDAARGPAGTPPTGFFAITNRNKRSLTLDLKNAAARDVVLRLAADADVLVEGLRPGVMDRLGIGYDAIRAVNPHIVYCSITGYGQTGPLADKAGHDANYQGYAGVLAQNAIDGGRPSPGGFPIADIAGGGMAAAAGILAVLFDVQRGGPGRHIDVSMTDCAMAFNVAPLASKYTNRGVMPEPGRDILSGALPCYRTYETADGRHLVFGALEAKFWSNFCTAVGRPDLAARGWDAGAGHAGTVAAISALVASKSRAEWTVLLENVDACITPVLSLDEALTHPHAVARELVIQVAAGAALETQYAFPLKMSEYKFAVRHLPPKLGEQRQDILRDLGYGEDEIASFIEMGLV
jgi:alpha-methylacyl-CoA racemase